MLKNIVKLECIIENKVYQLLCDNDSPLHHLKEVLFQFQKYVGQLEDDVKAQREAQEHPKVEDIPQEINEVANVD